jgi:hypothetical protein
MLRPYFDFFIECEFYFYGYDSLIKLLKWHFS